MEALNYHQQILENFDPRDEKCQSELVEKFGREKFRPGFDRLNPHLCELKDFFRERGVKVMTIGGTNGKGQTAFQTYGFCRREGLNVALWTSPHLLSLRERFLYNDSYISPDELASWVSRAGNCTLPLSFYEVLFWIFLQWTRERMEKGEPLDVLVFEVGLGGRLDAVNYFDADVSAIVSVGRDHQEYLGNKLKTILREKMGIRRSGKWLLSSLSTTYLRNELSQTHGREKSFDIFRDMPLGRETPYHMANAALAKELCLTLLGEGPRSLEQSEWQEVSGNPPWEGPGRAQEMTTPEFRFTFIGAHNLDGFRQMVKRLVNQRRVEGNDVYFSEGIIVSFSDRPEKEIVNCLETLAHGPCLTRRMVITCFTHPRACSREKLKKACKEVRGKASCAPVEIIFDPDWEYIQNACLGRENSKAPAKGSFLVAGSYYFLATFQRALRSHPSAGKL